MKKILTILTIICYSCTLFSQNSMNDIKRLEQKMDSIDNLINQLDSINYPVPIFENKLLSQLEKERWLNSNNAKINLLRDHLEEEKESNILYAHRTTYVGPRGGVYHYSKNGKKVYHKKRK